MLYKAENWYDSSHEQYFSEHRFLDICQCAFKEVPSYNSLLKDTLKAFDDFKNKQQKCMK